MKYAVTLVLVVIIAAMTRLSVSEIFQSREFLEFIGAVGTLLTLYVAKRQNDLKRTVEENGQINQTLELLIDTMEKRLALMDRPTNARTRKEDQ